jgi:hypothetical protein
MSLRRRFFAAAMLAAVIGVSSALAGGPAFGGQPGARAATAAGASLCVGSGAGCFATIQAAVGAAHDGDTILIGAGTFAGGVTIDVSVRIVGAGAASTIIDGGGPVLTIGVAGAPTEPTVTIDGVTVTGGNTIGNLSPASGRGGGIYIPRAAGPSTGATVTIRNSVVRDNRVAPAEALDSFASAGGGGVSNDGTLTLEHLLVTENHADAASGLTSEADGGGILNRAFGNLTLRNSVVTGNDARVSAPNGRGADGGGILAVAGALSVIDSVVSDNTVAASGASSDEINAHAGGLHSEAGVAATIRNSTFSGNIATAANTLADATAFCGGVCTDGDVDIRNGVVDQNHVIVTAALGDASGDSGGLGVGCCENPTTLVTIRDSSFTGNSVDATSAAGTAIAAAGGVSMANMPTLDLRDSLVSGNSVRATSTSGSAVVHGAGINNGGELELRNMTVSENAGTASGPTGEAQGGGIWNGAFDPTSPAPELTLLASALTHNSLAASPGITPQGGGLFTTVPVTLDDSVIASNSPDQCFGC